MAEAAEITVYFYKRLDGIYGAKFRSLFKTAEQLLNSQNEWKGAISRLTKREIDAGMELLKTKIGYDNNFNWPDIALTIGLCKPKNKKFGNALRLANQYLETVKADPVAVHGILKEVKRKVAKKVLTEKRAVPPPNPERSAMQKRLLNDVIKRHAKTNK